MFDIFGNLWDSFWKWTGFCSKQFRTIYHDELPDLFERNTIYIIGEKNHYWCIAMLCPCGCNVVIQLNLLPQAYPRWTFYQNKNATVTILPSIWRRTGCRSHFYIIGGRVLWCRGYIPSSSKIIATDEIR